MQSWQILNKFQYDPEKKDAIKNLVVNLLLNRGIKGQNQVEDFLNPDLKEVTVEKLGINKDDLVKGKDRIKNAIKNKEKIVIYTDYDADGILSGAILWETLYSDKADVMPFVPNRLTEGYGLSKEGIDRIKQDFNPDLIITVDHGITKVKEVDYALSLGIEVIIIDHHIPPPKLPKAVSIIHTTKLCATGLSWVFANYFMGKTHENLLDLVALATVADLVSLTGANRTLVRFGLEQINRTRRIGLSILIKKAGLKKGQLDTYSLSHVLAPRLNASGRLANALDALRLICTKDEGRAEKLAEEISQINKDRQKLTKESVELAVSQVQTDRGLIFTGHESFHQGIIGLIAGKLVESYKRPAIVVSIGIEICKASVRSVRGVNIVEFLRKAEHLLIDLGGHPMAAGFTFHRSNLDKLKLKLLKISDKIISKSDFIPEKIVDMELSPDFVGKNIFDGISNLSPFGQGNREPSFAAFNLNVVDFRLVGRERNHVKLTLSSDKNSKLIKAIAFNYSDFFSSVKPDSKIDIIYQIEKDDWNGQDRLILKLLDVRLTGAKL